MQAGQVGQAKRLFLQVVKSYKRDLEAWQALGLISWKQRKFEEAELFTREALDIEPRNHIAHYNLACILLSLGKQDEAADEFRKTLNYAPSYRQALVMLGNLYASESKLEDSAICFRTSLKINSSDAVAYSNLGNVYADQGRIHEALECWSRALEMARMQAHPHYAAAHSNRLLCLNYMSDYSPESVYHEHVEWSKRHDRWHGSELSYANTKDPDRSLRIGYVTPDLREHSVSYFLEPLLKNHNSLYFDIFCYADVGMEDKTTTRLLKLITHYRNTAGMSDDEIFSIVRNDKIDILVDLAGHTSGNRLLLFARKPAPIQVSYLGYPNTTGLRTIDYRLTDEWADPPGWTESLHTESLYRLPEGFLCYKPPEESPPVSVAPVTKNKYVTFGAFNYVGKTSPAVVAVWAKILRSVPGARLIFKNKSFTDETTRQRFQTLFEEHGLECDRVEMIGLTRSKSEHLAVYQRVDIALDTFPYNGTTTTCDTLWMGVPVITLAGKVHAGRVGVSLLNQIGLEELVASSIDEYVSLALALANDRERLVQLREHLRERVRRSRLCDGVSFARRLEEAYKNMWLKWCDS